MDFLPGIQPVHSYLKGLTTGLVHCVIVITLMLSILTLSGHLITSVKTNPTRSSAVVKRPRDALCLYSFYTLKWCGYPTVKKIRTYVYSF